MTTGDQPATTPCPSDTPQPCPRHGAASAPDHGPGDDQCGEPARSYARAALRRFVAHRPALASAAIVVVLLLLALLAGLLPLPDPTAQGADVVTDAGPSAQHWLGTDSAGRDILSRLIYGLRPAFVAGFAGQSLTMVLGVVLGVTAGYFRGWPDFVLSRLTDLLFTLPTFVLAFLAVGFLGPQFSQLAGGSGTMLLITVVFAALGWPGLLRLVRAQTLSLKEQPFVEAARAVGSSNWQIIRWHILPGTWGQVLVQAAFGVGGFIALESTLSLLGLGVQPPNPDLGAMVASGLDGLTANPFESLAPSFVLTMLIVAFVYVGDGLRDALDPRLSA
jgi:oligopeptide transport system permease protein